MSDITNPSVGAAAESIVGGGEADPMRNNFFGLFDMPADILSIFYAATVALGGIMGYATKRELMVIDRIV